MSKNVITVKDLWFGYGGPWILQHVNFTVYSEDFVGIIGSNGAGKSTLLRLLLGELTPQRGDIRIFDIPVREYRQWPRIGYVPQNGAAVTGRFPATALEVVQANLYARIGPLRPPKKEHRALAMEALMAVGMAELSGKLIGELSGGQLQRVLIARALASHPDMLLLDEPTAGVDAESADDLYHLLDSLHKQGITIVMVTHDLDRTARYTNRALCIEDSTLVVLEKEQIAQEMLHRHSHPHISDHTETEEGL